MKKKILGYFQSINCINVSLFDVVFVVKQVAMCKNVYI